MKSVQVFEFIILGFYRIYLIYFFKFFLVEKTRKVKPIVHSPGFESEDVEEEEFIKAGPSKRGMADELSAHSTIFDPKRKFQQGNDLTRHFQKTINEFLFF